MFERDVHTLPVRGAEEDDYVGANVLDAELQRASQVMAQLEDLVVG